MAEDFSRAVLNQSVARACLALGIQETSPNCIDALSDILQSYIQTIGEKSLEHAESSGREHPGLQDVLNTLASSVRIFYFCFKIVYSTS